MEFNLTTTQKIASINESKRNMLHEVFGLLVRLGIDPDEFDSTTWVPGESPTGGELDSDDLDMQINKRQSRPIVDGYVLVGGPDKRTENRALDAHEGLWMCWK